ncbi:MAG: hypothetical protein M0C28_24510 [Candidatus Moduliflexus flocculans]|nr:hypothetical protein [Candidatus Moduliflexus flocculans]
MCQRCGSVARQVGLAAIRAECGLRALSRHGRCARRGVRRPAPGVTLMCQRSVYRKCGKPTWVGCGRHVDEVLRDVPPAGRCQCPRPKSWLARLLGF